MLTPEIVKKLTLIHEYKGEQRLFIEAHKDELEELVEIAKVQSTEASNKIEGISTAGDRLKNLVQAKTTPRNRDESEIAGYRDVLNGKYISIQFSTGPKVGQTIKYSLEMCLKNGLIELI